MRQGKPGLVLALLLFTLMVSVLPIQVSAAQSAAPLLTSAWLQKISEANLKQSYRGTFIYRCNAQLVAMKIIHAANQDGGFEKLFALNGPEHEVVQNGQLMTSSLFRGKRVMAGGLSKSNAEEYEGNLDAHYQIAEVGADRIADRHTTVMEIRPSDKFRYGFLIWLDNDTGIVLRSDMIDEEGKVIEQVMFVDLEMLADQDALRFIGDAQGASEQQADDEAMTRAKTDSLSDSQWRANNIPSGFKLSERYLRKDADNGVSQEQLVFTDGLASVSIFIEPYSKNEEPMVGETNIGAINVYGKLINDHQIMVVGDVPKSTVEFIAGSLTMR